MEVRVRAPASTANLGPGFDCLGGALSAELTVEVTPSGRSGGLIGKAAELVSGDAREVAYEITGGFPAGRGLGFSAAEVAAGLLIGCALAGKEPDPLELLALGTPLEGHADNLAPSLLGGVTAVLPNNDVLRYAPNVDVRPLIFVPETQLATKQARKALPDTVPRTDAVANLARSAGLLAVMNGSSEATVELLLECTEDLLHQPYRAPLMPVTADAIASLRSRGIAAAVSGAGPSIVCLVIRGSEPDVTLDGWDLLDADWSLAGARID